MGNTEHFDAVIVGGGHNGLTTACYLAAGGMRVCVLERRHIVGGAAVTECFHPGFRNSIASYVVSLLRPEIIRDLDLVAHGYDVIPLHNSFYPWRDGSYLLFKDDPEHDAREVARFSSTDYASLSDFYGALSEVGEILARQWLREPPEFTAPGMDDLLKALRLGMDVRRLDATGRQRLMQFLLAAPSSLIDRSFESPQLKAVVAANCLPGNYASLQQPGSAIAMLHHAVGEVAGERGAWGLVRGGMGSVTQAMAAAARARGVEIRTGADVVSIDVSERRAIGATLADGTALRAPVVAANTDPVRTFLRLVGAQHLPADFAKDIAVFRQDSASLRMNLALRGVPQFACLPGGELGDHHRASMMFIDDKDHVERAYFAARQGRPADPPIIEALMPSAVDDSLVDTPGHHVMSLLCKYMPYSLAGDQSWDRIRDEVASSIVRHLGTFIPNLQEILVGVQCLTPLDLERTFGLTRGDISHGKLEADQLYSMRPHPAAARYATPIEGLYLCGAGAHPGGGVSGAPGHNAARRILKDRG